MSLDALTPSRFLFSLGTCLCLTVLSPIALQAEGDWEITPESQAALANGLRWLAKHQGPQGNWDCNELGVVSLGALAFLADGHLPERGAYGDAVQRTLDYVLRNERPPGLLNIATAQHDMYNHGLSTFVLGQAYGMTSDPRLGAALDRALKLIADTQAEDGGWGYQARRMSQGNDLSLAVMQAKALRSAVDVGLQVSPQVIEQAIHSVRGHYTPRGCKYTDSEEVQKQYPGQFTYKKGGGNATTAMAAAGVVCLQEFAQYDDWRIPKSLEVISAAIQREVGEGRRGGIGVFDPYTLYYVAQALYQAGGKPWEENYPRLRDAIVRRQGRDGMWAHNGRLSGRPGELYMTSVACFVLAIPNRYLPILQEGKIDSLKEQFQRREKSN